MASCVERRERDEGRVEERRRVARARWPARREKERLLGCDAEVLLNGSGGDCSFQPQSHSHSQSSHGQASSSPAAATPRPRPSAVCIKLWHACAGLIAPMPRKESVVVYLPQGHLDHLSDTPAA